MRADGGEETQVFDAAVNAENWAVVERGIYFLTSQPGQSHYILEFFDFATRQTTQITTLEGPKGVFQISSLTISPDKLCISFLPDLTVDAKIEGCLRMSDWQYHIKLDRKVALKILLAELAALHLFDSDRASR